MQPEYGFILAVAILAVTRLRKTLHIPHLEKMKFNARKYGVPVKKLLQHKVLCPDCHVILLR